MVNLSDQIVDVFRNAGYEVKVWDEAEAEPSIELALSCSKVLLDFEPQLVVGFGGGSAIDVAKAAWLLYERPDLSSIELAKAVVPRTKLNLRKKARFIAVPTTSGTGADVTWAIILTDTGYFPMLLPVLSSNVWSVPAGRVREDSCGQAMVKRYVR